MPPSGMTSKELRHRPIAGKWSTLEVVCHLTDCEQFFADRRSEPGDGPPAVGRGGRVPYPDPVQYHQRNLDEELELLRRHASCSLIVPMG